MTVTVAAITDFGPVAEVDEKLRAMLQQGVDYYVAEGIEGERFTTATVGEATFTSNPAPRDRTLRSRRIEAEVTFA